MRSSTPDRLMGKRSSSSYDILVSGSRKVNTGLVFLSDTDPFVSKADNDDRKCNDDKKFTYGCKTSCALEGFSVSVVD